MLGSLYW